MAGLNYMAPYKMQDDKTRDYLRELSHGQWINVLSLIRWVYKNYPDNPHKKVEQLLSLPFARFASLDINMDKSYFLSLVPDVIEMMRMGQDIQLRASYRLCGDFCIPFRQSLGLEMNPVDVTCPRFFAGRVEADVLEEYPQKEIYCFTCSGVFLEEDILKFTRQVHGYAYYSPFDKITRLYVPYGYQYVPEVSALVKKYSGRMNHSTTRLRFIELLPYDFVSELIEYYVHFLEVSLANRESVIRQVYDEQEFKGVLATWIYDILGRYNEKSGIPFGAYLLQICRLWVGEITKHNVGPYIYNSSISLRNAYRKVEESNKEHTEREHAQAIGMSFDRYMKMKKAVHQSKLISNPAVSLDAPARETEDKDTTIANVIPDETRIPDLACRITYEIFTQLDGDKETFRDVVEYYTHPHNRKLSGGAKEFLEYLKPILACYTTTTEEN